MKTYKVLEQTFRRIAAVNGALAMLGWDQSAMMPDGGAKARAEQMATLSVVRHDWLTDPALGERIAKAETEVGKLSDWQPANLLEGRRKGRPDERGVGQGCCRLCRLWWWRI